MDSNILRNRIKCRQLPNKQLFYRAQRAGDWAARLHYLQPIPKIVDSVNTGLSNLDTNGSVRNGTQRAAGQLRSAAEVVQTAKTADG